MSHIGIELRVRIPAGVILQANSDMLHYRSRLVGWDNIGQWSEVLATIDGLVIESRPVDLPDEWGDGVDQEDGEDLDERIRIRPCADQADAGDVDQAAADVSSPEQVSPASAGSTPRQESSMQSDDLDNRFTYHPPKKGQPALYEWIRHAGLIMANGINERCPDSREKSLAITKIEEAVFWANAAIARSHDVDQADEAGPARTDPDGSGRDRTDQNGTERERTGAYGTDHDTLHCAYCEGPCPGIGRMEPDGPPSVAEAAILYKIRQSPTLPDLMRLWTRGEAQIAFVKLPNEWTKARDRS